MRAPAILWPVVTVLTWPVSRFRDVGRTYDVALAPADARALVRGAIGTDPMHLPVMEGIAASRRSDVVGRVDDDGRLAIYIGGKSSSGIGLVGSVSALGEGSRIATRVGWIGLRRWFEPAVRIFVLYAVGCAAYVAVTASDSFDVGASAALAAMLAGAWFLNIRWRAQSARQDELPRIFERLERVLAPHLRQPPTRG
jgi:hypothetical protein